MHRLYTLVFALLLLALAGCERNEQGIILHTADPALSFLVLIPQALPDEVGEVVPIPPLEPPCEMIVKGNINRQGEKIAHVPTDPNYGQVKIDESAGEKWFCSLEDAEAEGWRPVKN